MIMRASLNYKNHNDVGDLPKHHRGFPDARVGEPVGQVPGRGRIRRARVRYTGFFVRNSDVIYVSLVRYLE